MDIIDEASMLLECCCEDDRHIPVKREHLVAFSLLRGAHRSLDASTRSPLAHPEGPGAVVALVCPAQRLAQDGLEDAIYSLFEGIGFSRSSVMKDEYEEPECVSLFVGLDSATAAFECARLVSEGLAAILGEPQLGGFRVQIDYQASTPAPSASEAVEASTTQAAADVKAYKTPVTPMRPRPRAQSPRQS
jgi:hypothetical protein